VGRIDGDADGGVVVPWAPGPVARVAARAPSDVDAALDELFGPADDGGPSWFDVVLVVAGVALLLRGAVAAGVVALALGLALPLRSLSRRARRAARRRRYRRLLAAGQPLATGHDETEALLAAYEALLDAAASPELLERVAVDAVAAAHGAVVECASLLGGGVPHTEAEAAYVARRTAAVRSLESALRAASARAAQPGDGADLAARTALVRGREEVDALGGGPALTDLREVAARVERAP
jgi:hypothetical protein